MPRASEKAIKLAKEVLGKCMAYDPHFARPSEAVILAWAEHIGIRNPAREDMLDAVARFYENNTEGTKPLPGAISSIARQVKQDRAMRSEYQPPLDKSADPDPPAPEGSEKISLREWERRHKTQFPRGKVFRTVDEAEVQDALPVNPLRVSCPHCKSSAGTPCTVPGTTHVLRKHRAHPSRVDAALEEAEG